MVDQDALDEMRARWEIITAPGFDVYNLSFGEFFAADPALFVATVNQAFAAMRIAAPGAAMSATIHVGASADQRVTYQGEEMAYYFLVQFADPRILPLVPTVMYYDLFEDAGGAYHHDEFDEHRAFLLERLAAGEPVAYFPGRRPAGRAARRQRHGLQLRLPRHGGSPVLLGARAGRDRRSGRRAGHQRAGLHHVSGPVELP